MQNTFLGKKFSKFSLFLLLAAMLATLAGCGAGSGAPAGTAATTTPTQTITGTVAIGAPLASATVTIKDSTVPAKTVSGKTSGNGTFGLNVTGFKPPFMLVAAPADPNQQNMYSILPAMVMTSTISQTVNITPVTTLVMYELNNGTDPASMYTLASFTPLTPANVSEATLTVRNKLAAALNNVNPAFDVMYGAFTAGTGDSTGYDAALNNLGAIKSITSSGVTFFGPTVYTSSGTGALVGSATVTSGSASITADGTSSTFIRAAVTGANGPLSGVTVSFVTTAGTLSATPSASGATTTAVTDAKGVAQLYLIAPTIIGKATVTAGTSGASGSATVTFTAGKAAKVVGLNASPNSVNPGGTSTLVASVLDTYGNPLTGETVTFSVAPPAGSGAPTFNPTSIATDINGLAKTIYTAGTSSGTDTIRATTSNSTTSSIDVSVSPANVVVSTVDIAAGTASLPTGGSSTVIRATVKNAGVALAGIPVSFTTTAGTLSAATATTDANGNAQVMLTSGSNVGTATVSAYAGGFLNTATVTFIASTANAVVVKPSPASVSSGATSTLNATVLDAQGNPVANQTVTFALTANNSGATLAPATAVTNASGLATTVYTAGTVAASDTITATLTNGKTSTTSIAVTASPTPVVTSLSLSASPTTVKSDNSSTTTFTVTALSASNAAIPNVVVALGSAVTADLSGALGVAGGGILSAQTVTTGPTGQATFTFSSGIVNKDNRTVTVTATSGTASTTYPVRIIGSTVTPNPGNLSVTSSGSLPVVTQVVTFTAKDAGGNSVPGTAISVVASGTGAVTVTPCTPATSGCPSGITYTSGIADINGQYAVVVAGGASTGSATLTATALGTTTTSTVTVTGTPFGISSLTLNGAALTSANTNTYTVAAMQNTGSLAVLVNAPNSASVRFATTLGIWDGVPNQSTVSKGVGVPCAGVTPSATQACAVLTTANTAGLASVQVTDPSNAALSAALSISVTATIPNTITLQASPAVVPKGPGGVSTLIATVRDASGLPVGGMPVTFSIVDCAPSSCNSPTGGGESVSPVVVYTAMTATSALGLGQASTTFTAGSLSSTAKGVQIKASVPGYAVTTTAAVVIGGTAGSVAFGQATKLIESADKTTYILNMSVLVADSNGNPAPAGTVVNLSAWPIAWSTGGACLFDLDGPTKGTFWNEDINENLILDPGEDGTRVYWATQPWSSAIGAGAVTGGSKDGVLTPTNSAAGIVQSAKPTDLPGTVTTDANGSGSFTLTYPKTSAIYIIDRIRARTVVQGTETVGQTIFRLAPLQADTQPACILPNSSFYF